MPRKALTQAGGCQTASAPPFIGNAKEVVEMKHGAG